MQFTGIIKNALPAVQGIAKSGKQWQKQEFILEEAMEKDYKSSVIVTVMRLPLMAWMSTHIGQVVTIDIDPRAREYNGRYYQDLVCWGCIQDGLRVGIELQGQPQSESHTNNTPFTQQQGNAVYKAKDIPPINGDLPF